MSTAIYLFPMLYIQFKAEICHKLKLTHAALNLGWFLGLNFVLVLYLASEMKKLKIFCQGDFVRMHDHMYACKFLFFFI